MSTPQINPGDDPNAHLDISFGHSHGVSAHSFTEAHR